AILFVLPLMFYSASHTHFRLSTRRGARQLILHLLAIFADSPHSQTVMRRTESEFVRHLILQIFDVGRKEFDDLPALGADHMIVMLMIEVMLVISLVVSETNFAGESRLCEKFQSSVDGCMTDRFVF